jgi:hypothetical protein
MDHVREGAERGGERGTGVSCLRVDVKERRQTEMDILTRFLAAWRAANNNGDETQAASAAGR